MASRMERPSWPTFLGVSRGGHGSPGVASTLQEEVGLGFAGEPSTVLIIQALVHRQDLPEHLIHSPCHSDILHRRSFASNLVSLRRLDLIVMGVTGGATPTRRSSHRARDVLHGVARLPVPLRGRVAQLLNIYLTAVPTGIPQTTLDMLLSNLAEFVSEAPTTPQTEHMAMDVLAQTVVDLTNLRGGTECHAEEEPETPVP